MESQEFETELLFPSDVFSEKRLRLELEIGEDKEKLPPTYFFVLLYLSDFMCFQMHLLWNLRETYDAIIRKNRQ